jgi:hypothetical protein
MEELDLNQPAIVFSMHHPGDKRALNGSKTLFTLS